MDDALSYIFTFIAEGSTYKAVCLVNTTWNKLVRQVHPQGDVKFVNHLMTLLKSFPEKTLEMAKLILKSAYNS